MILWDCSVVPRSLGVPMLDPLLQASVDGDRGCLVYPNLVVMSWQLVTVAPLADLAETVSLLKLRCEDLSLLFLIHWWKRRGV